MIRYISRDNMRLISSVYKRDYDLFSEIKTITIKNKELI